MLLNVTGTTSSGSAAPSNRTIARARIRRVRWRDLRLWFGLALIVVAMLAGARLLAGPDDETLVWRASRDLSVGSVPQAEAVTVRLGDATASYASAQVPLEGRMLLAVPAGALIPRDAIGVPPVTGARQVTIPLDPLHAPVDLASGDRVDVWSTPKDVADRVTATPVLVLANVPVLAADREALGISGEMPVVLEIPEGDVATIVAAMRTGVIDLAGLPLAEQQS